MKVLENYSFKSYTLSLLDYHERFLPKGEKVLTRANAQETVITIVLETIGNDKSYQILLDFASQYPQIATMKVEENNYYFQKLPYQGAIQLIASALAITIEDLLIKSLKIKKGNKSNIVSLKEYCKQKKA